MTEVEWHPYANPLPKPNKRYLVTVQTAKKMKVLISPLLRSSAFRYVGNWPNGVVNSDFSFPLPVELDFSRFVRVTAWAPLPKPYRKSSPTPEWHDYMEEKPPKHGWHLVTIRYGRFAHVCLKQFDLESGKFLIKKNKKQESIVGWTELPEPYMEKDNDGS